MTDTPALVAPAFVPTRLELVALERLSMARYRRRTSYWTAAGRPNVAHNLIDVLRHAGLVRTCNVGRNPADAATLAELTSYGRAVLDYYRLAGTPRRRRT